MIDTAPRLGSAAPPLVGVEVSGSAFDLATLRPRAVLVEFHRGTW